LNVIRIDEAAKVAVDVAGDFVMGEDVMDSTPLSKPSTVFFRS
jgi:hypothetical protein